MKAKQQTSFSLIDFLIDIANECFFANGSSASPYDVNFTNHYNALYDFEKTITPTKSAPISKVVMDKKNKSVRADYNGIALSQKQKNAVIEYCSNNSIKCEIKNDKLMAVVIDKDSAGVVDTRNWKKEL
jgi:hypothetical protein